MQITSIKYANDEQTLLLVNGKHNVPWPCRTWHRDHIQGWIDAGNSIAPFQSSLEALRASKKVDIKAELLRRINVDLPNIDTVEELKVLVNYAPAFQLSAAGNRAKDTYIYGMGRLDLVDTATETQLNNYDPVTDPGWPT